LALRRRLPLQALEARVLPLVHQEPEAAGVVVAGVAVLLLHRIQLRSCAAQTVSRI
jgi:uncharacterized protein YqfA (UPF0365 family)